MSNLGYGTVLQANVTSPTYSATYYDPRGASELRFPLPSVPFLKLAAVHNHEGGTVTLFALNRHLEESLSMDAVVRGFEGLGFAEAHQLRHDNLMAVNTKDAPEEIKPTSLKGIEVQGDRVRADLAPASWNVIRLNAKGRQHG
jgi:alpha-L-arabinofuranosidase